MKRKTKIYCFAVTAIFLLFILPIKASAIEYTISFTGTGASNLVGNVIVINMTRGTTVTVPTGNVLFLSNVVSSIDKVTQGGDGMSVYPNFMQAKSTVSFFAKHAGATQIDVFDLVGKKIVGKNKVLLQGINSFQLSMPKGIYIIHVQGVGFSYSAKAINPINLEIQPQITFTGNENQLVNKPQKSKSTVTNMLFNTGDQLIYKGISDNYSTIITDIPTGNKNINFEFAECKDADDNYYTVVKIGTQTWMAENLKTSHYRTGESISNITNDVTWGLATYGAWCYFDNNVDRNSKFGNLYNWFAVSDLRKIAPVGWHVASDDEYTTLKDYVSLNLGNSPNVAKALSSNADWNIDNGTNTVGNDLTLNNSSGFSALPAGSRNGSSFGALNNYGHFWSSTDNSIHAGTNESWLNYISYNTSGVVRQNGLHTVGLSVRCIRDAVPGLNTTTIINGTSRTLQDAITKLNDSGIIIIKGKVIIDESIIIPSTIILEVHDGGRIELQGTSTFKTNGEVRAGLYAVFNSKVEFLEGSVAIVKTEWFGTNDLAVNYALLSAGAIPVKATNDITVKSAILMNSNQTFIFKDATIFTSAPMTGGAVIKNRNATDRNITVVGGIINGAGTTSVAYDAILLKNVDNALIQDVVARDVHIIASTDSGNFHLINCTNSTIKDVEAHDTWKMGIKVDGGSYITITGGYFTGTHDSGIGAINSLNMHVTGVYVDSCGTTNASNIAMNLQNGIFENSISVNAPGTTNGNGLTVGHEGYPAFNSIIRNNLFINNGTKGVWSQGSTNTDISILNNIIMGNGKGSIHSNSAGITTYYGALRTLIQGNEIIGNVRGVNLTNTSSTTTIFDNRIINSDLYGIDNDGISTTIEANVLSNTINIFNDTQHTNLTKTNNVETAPQNPISYNYLYTLPWITDLQKVVLNNLLVVDIDAI